LRATVAFFGVVIAGRNNAVAMGRSRATSAQSFTLWQQATIEITRRDHSITACSRHAYMGAHSSRTSRSWRMQRRLPMVSQKQSTGS